ncbi:hypothetical protein [Streptomyces sp. NPDC006925]|uniref:hypothetical protein n=1 Tax=Streptomyces sp. NPDC006925 TaxID=3364768 RepID=UPI00367CFB17
MTYRPSAPTTDSPAPWLPITSRPQETTMTDRCAFLVLRTDDPDPDRQSLRSGTTPTAPDPRAIAEEIAQETRLARDYWGPMTVGIWSADTDPTPAQALRDGMPDGATTYTFGEVTHRRERCPAAHTEDPTPCDGPPVVTVLDRQGAGADGCAHHGARLLASLDGGRVYPLPDAPDGAAIEVFTAADSTRPFPWYEHAPRTQPEALSREENRERGDR